MDTTIHPRDEMWLYLRSLATSKAERFNHYFSTGFEISSLIESILTGLGVSLAEVASLLDFASGYGRATRFLAEQMPADRITVSDICAEAVEFQKSHFGVNGFVSSYEPASIEIPCSYDVVTCISLFTHLPENLFVAWLEKLLGACSEKGILVFTTHPFGTSPKTGDRLLWDRLPFWKRFSFVPDSHAESLDPACYGRSHVSRAWVQKLFRSRLKDWKIGLYCKRGLHHQDVYVAVRREQTNTPLRCLPTLSGSLDELQVHDGRAHYYGWAYSATSFAPVRRVEAFWDGIPMGQASTGCARPDVAEHFQDSRAHDSGFSGSFPVPQRAGESTFWIQATLADHRPMRRFIHYQPESPDP